MMYIAAFAWMHIPCQPNGYGHSQTFAFCDTSRANWLTKCKLLGDGGDSIYVEKMESINEVHGFEGQRPHSIGSPGPCCIKRTARDHAPAV